VEAARFHRQCDWILSVTVRLLDEVQAKVSWNFQMK